MNVLGHADRNTFATADFYQRNFVQACSLIGEYLRNGNFIFSLEDAPFKKMVLTDNHGNYVEHGCMYLFKVDESNWKDAENWIGRSTNGFYSIMNFQGNKGRLC